MIEIIFLYILIQTTFINKTDLLFQKTNIPVSNNWDNLVIGDTMFNEGAQFDLYDCIGFDKTLDDATIHKIVNILKR